MVEGANKFLFFCPSTYRPNGNNNIKFKVKTATFSLNVIYTKCVFFSAQNNTKYSLSVQYSWVFKQYKMKKMSLFPYFITCQNRQNSNIFGQLENIILKITCFISHCQKCSHFIHLQNVFVIRLCFRFVFDLQCK